VVAGCYGQQSRSRKGALIRANAGKRGCCKLGDRCFRKPLLYPMSYEGISVYLPWSGRPLLRSGNPTVDTNSLRGLAEADAAPKAWPTRTKGSFRQPNAARWGGSRRRRAAA
jgi:hypothetical protein